MSKLPFALLGLLAFVSPARASMLLLGAGPGVDVASGAPTPLYSQDFTANQTLPSWLGVSSPSLGGLVADANGYLTYAGNNLLTGSTALATQTVAASSGIGPQSNFLLACYGTGSITLSGAAAGSLTCGGASQAYKTIPAPTATGLTLTVSGTVTNASLSAVTYETAPRAVDAVYGASPYYGPKFDVGQGLRLWAASENYDKAISSLASVQTVSVKGVSGPDGQSASGYTTTFATGSVIPQIYATLTASSVPNTVTTDFMYTNWKYAFVGVQGTTGYCGAVFDLTGVASPTIEADANCHTTSTSTTSLANGFVRLSFTATVTNLSYALIAASPSMTPTMNSSYGTPAAATYPTSSTFQIFGMQDEHASFPGPYIPTAASAVTTAADAPSSAIMASNPTILEWMSYTGAVTWTAYPTGVSSWAALTNGWLQKACVYQTGASGSTLTAYAAGGHC